VHRPTVLKCDTLAHYGSPGAAEVDGTVKMHFRSNPMADGAQIVHI